MDARNKTSNLQKELDNIEVNLGSYSPDFLCQTQIQTQSQNTMKAEDMEFEKKPAQQLLKGLGCHNIKYTFEFTSSFKDNKGQQNTNIIYITDGKYRIFGANGQLQTGKFDLKSTKNIKKIEDLTQRDKDAILDAAVKNSHATSNRTSALSQLPEGKNLQDKGVLKSDVEIVGFNDDQKKLVITKEALEKLSKSAKIYLNEEFLNENDFEQLKTNYNPKKKNDLMHSGQYYLNLATQICHAQEIHILVEHVVNDQKVAIAEPKVGTITDTEKSIILLSSPALSFIKDQPGHVLNSEEKRKFIEGMYSILFKAALDQKCTHIVLPPAGLGAFQGNPDDYFPALIRVAKNFPNLNIIYNPGKDQQKFIDALTADKAENIAISNKELLSTADALRKKGIRCALHNPSDADVVFGHRDVGQYWKTGKGPCYVGEEHIGAMTTAPLNSRLLNPSAYTDVILITGPSKEFVEKVKELLNKEDFLMEHESRNIINKFFNDSAVINQSSIVKKLKEVIQKDEYSPSGKIKSALIDEVTYVLSKEKVGDSFITLKKLNVHNTGEWTEKFMKAIKSGDLKELKRFETDYREMMESEAKNSNSSDTSQTPGKENNKNKF